MEMVKARVVGCKKSSGPRDKAIVRYMVQLKRMVPSLRGHTKIRKLELLQHVIDYIQDLEVTLAEDQLDVMPSSSPSPQRTIPVI